MITIAAAEALTLPEIRRIIARQFGGEGDGPEFLALVALERMRKASKQGWAWHYRLPSGAGYGLSSADQAAWQAAHRASYAAALAWCAGHIGRDLAHSST